MSIFGLISCGINFSLIIIYFLHNKHTCSEFYFLVLQQKQWEQIFPVESFATHSYFHGSVFQNTYCELIFVIIRVIAMNRMLFTILLLYDQNTIFFLDFSVNIVSARYFFLLFYSTLSSVLKTSLYLSLIHI